MQARIGSANLEWNSLTFSYIQTPYRFHAACKAGVWTAGNLTQDNRLTISEGATALNYGQAVFEGLKARATADGRVAIFRLDQNALRMSRSAKRLAMQAVADDLFEQAATDVVRANLAYVPPYSAIGATFYLRPLLLGVGDKLGLQPADEYLFVLYGAPVGPYFTGGKQTIRLTTCENDRAATRGIGNIKASGNYPSTLLDRAKAKAEGYDDILYLDSATRNYIDEVGSANLFAIKGNTLITPDSPTILPSVTRISLVELAEELGMQIEQRPVAVNELASFDEVGCCGTAVVIAPISEIRTAQQTYRYTDQMGPKSRQLYQALHAIQWHTADRIQKFDKWLTFVT